MNASSKLKGVSWRENRGKWRAYLSHGEKQTHLGVFSDETEAAKAYDVAAAKEYGEFAKLNFLAEA